MYNLYCPVTLQRLVVAFFLITVVTKHYSCCTSASGHAVITSFQYDEMFPKLGHRSSARVVGAAISDLNESLMSRACPTADMLFSPSSCSHAQN